MYLEIDRKLIKDVAEIEDISNGCIQITYYDGTTEIFQNVYKLEAVLMRY